MTMTANTGKPAPLDPDAYANEVTYPGGELKLVYAMYLARYATEEERTYPRVPLYR
jgi:hypothetical protein